MKLIDSGDYDKFTNYQNWYNELDPGDKWIAKYAQSSKGQIRSTEDVIQANRAARDSALEYNAALKQQTLSAQVGKVALSALAAAGNMLLFTAVTKGIELITNAIDNWIHADEIAVEKAEDARSRIADINSSYVSHRKTVDDCAAAYEKLSKGVNTATNENLSLSDADYRSYLDICNQLAETFPTLSTRSDEYGNAILSLGRKGRTASEDLEELLKTEADLNNYRIAEDVDTLFDGALVKIKDAQKEKNQADDAQAKLDGMKQIASGEWDLRDGIHISGDMADKNDAMIYQQIGAPLTGFYNQLEPDKKSKYQDILDPAGVLAVGSTGKFNIDINTSTMEKEDAALLKKSFILPKKDILKPLEDKANDLEYSYSDAQAEADLMWKDTLATLTAQMKTKSAFKDLGNDEYGKEMQDLAIDFVSGLGTDTAEDMEASGDSYEWIRSNILSPLVKLDGSGQEKLSATYQKLQQLNPNDLSTQNQSEIDRLVGMIAGLLQKTDDEIRSGLGYGYEEDVKKAYDNAIQNASQKYDKPTNEMERTFTDLGIDTMDEIEDWNKITAGANFAAEAVRMYKKEKTKDIEVLPFADAWESLDTTEDESLKSLKEDLLSLAEAGELTVESFKATEGSGSFLAQLGIDKNDTARIKGIVADINKMRSSASKLSSMKDGISSLSGNLYAKEQNPGTAIGKDVLNGMDDGLKTQTAEWDNYVAVMGNSSSSIEEAKKATADLAAAYINSSSSLAGLTDSEKEHYAAQLNAMGLTGAQEALESSIAAARAAETLGLDELSFATEESANQTYAQINALINEGEITGTTAAALFHLIATEQIFANQSLNTSGKIAELNRLALAFGIVADSSAAAAAAAEISDKSNMMARAGKSPEYIRNETGKVLGRYTAGIEEQIRSQSGGKTPAGRGGSGGGSSKNQTAETFDFIETAISRAESAINRFKEKASSAFETFRDRGKAYSDALSHVSNEIDIQTSAKEKYQAKADSVGLEDEWAKKVRDGSLDIDEVKDDGLKERIRQYKEWYEKALACGEKIEELKKTQRELTQEKIELLIKKYDKLFSQLESKLSRIKNRMDLKEMFGISASSKDYKTIDKTIRRQTSSLVQQRAELKNLMATVPKNSEQWLEYNDRLNQNTEAFQKQTKAMAENAVAAAALAKARAEKKNAKRDTEDEKLDTKLSTASSAERKNSLLNTKAKNIGARQDNLKEAYKSSINARVSYGKRIQKASKKGVSKKNKKLFQRAISCVKSKKLISASIINDINNAIMSASGKELSSLKTLLSYCMNYNANKNAEEENKQNYLMYALTAQAEKKSLREERLQNSLDENQSKADRSTTSLAETAAAKNRNIDVQTYKNRQNVAAYETATGNAVADQNAAAKKANFSNTKTFKKLKNKNLKEKLQKVADTIKARKKIEKEGMEAVKQYCKKYLKENYTYYHNCQAYNEAIENTLSAKEAETLAKAEAYAAERQAELEKASNTVAERDTQNDLYSATARNQTSAAAKNDYVDKQISNIRNNANTYAGSYNNAAMAFNTARNTVIWSSTGDVSKQAVIDEIKSKFVNQNILIPAEYLDKAYTVSNEFGLACSNYNESLEAANIAKETYDLYQQTAQTDIASLAMERFSNTEQEFANKQNTILSGKNKASAAQALKSVKGIALTEDDYREMLGYGSQEEQNYTNEITALNKIITDNITSGYWTAESQEYLDAANSVSEYKIKLSECQQEQEELNNKIAQLPYEKYEKALALLDSIASYNKSASDLAKAQGADLSAGDYLTQLMDVNKKIREYEKERTQALTDYGLASASPDGVYGGKTADEWKEKFHELGTTINGLKADSIELRNSLRDDVYWRSFERAHEAAQRLNDTLSGMSDLIDDSMLYDENGSFTNYGVSKMANTIKQYETAREEVQNYTDDIKNLNALYTRGYYTQEEFNEKLSELQKGLLGSASSMKSYISEIIDMNKNLAQSELDALFEVIDARNDALDAKKEYYDYDKTIQDKTKDIQALQSQLGALEGIDGAEAKAQRARLEADLAEANEDLNDTIMEHSFELSKDALDNLKEILQDEFDDHWDNIWKNLDEIKNLMDTGNKLTASQSSSIGETMEGILSFYGVKDSETMLSSSMAQQENTIKLADGTEIFPLDAIEYLKSRNIIKDTWNPENASYINATSSYTPDITPKTSGIPDNLPSAMNFTQHYDNLLNVEGNVDSTVITDLNKFAKTFYQGSYEYTIAKISNEARKVGIKV